MHFPPSCGEGLRVGVAPLLDHQTPAPNPSPQGGGEFRDYPRADDYDGIFCKVHFLTGVNDG